MHPIENLQNDEDTYRNTHTHPKMQLGSLRATKLCNITAATSESCVSYHSILYKYS